MLFVSHWAQAPWPLLSVLQRHSRWHTQVSTTAQYSTQHVHFYQSLFFPNLTPGQPFTQSGLQVACCSPLLTIPCPFYQDKRGQGHWQDGALGLHAGFQAWRTIRGWCWRDPWDPPPLPHIHPCPSFQYQHGAKTLCGLFRHRLRSCSGIPQGCTLCVWWKDTNKGVYPCSEKLLAVIFFMESFISIIIFPAI